MKLHLPVSLLSALLLCLSLAPNSAQAATTLGNYTYSGDIYTWVGGGTSNYLSNGGIAKTTELDSEISYESTITKACHNYFVLPLVPSIVLQLTII
jgi:hypothetical protein